MKLDLKKGEILVKAHSLNMQIHEESISLDQIVSIKPSRTFYVLPNQISVELANGREERYVVWNRKSWIEKIEQIKRKMA